MTTAPVHLFTVQLQDEAPAIGCGFRFVFVKQGRKWVYLLSPYTMRACKIERGVWDELRAVEITAPDVLRRARQALQQGRSVQQGVWRREHTHLERQALEGGSET